MKKNINTFNVVVALIILIAIAVSIQSYSFGSKMEPHGLDTKYNNYLIFKSSAMHLFQGKDLYSLHPEKHYDLYKYSPAFSVFMIPFTILPDLLGLILWNLINAIALIIGLRMLPNLSRRQVGFILLIGLLELTGSIMNEQSNGLMAGMMILGIAFLERDKPVLATLFLVFSIYIKLFSIVAFMMLLFYPRFWKNCLYSISWIVFFAIVPILIIGWQGLTDTYVSWYTLLQNDFTDSMGYSVLGILIKWFNFSGSGNIIIVIGVLLMLLLLVNTKRYSKVLFRYNLLSAILIWVIIFNHKAESPTFIIAMTGIGLYIVSNPLSTINKVLLVLSILFVSLVYSDLSPMNWRNIFFHPYYIKAVPCILVWFKILYDEMIIYSVIKVRSVERHN